GLVPELVGQGTVAVRFLFVVPAPGVGQFQTGLQAEAPSELPRSGHLLPPLRQEAPKARRPFPVSPAVAPEARVQISYRLQRLPAAHHAATGVGVRAERV